MCVIPMGGKECQESGRVVALCVYPHGLVALDGGVYLFDPRNDGSNQRRSTNGLRFRAKKGIWAKEKEREGGREGKLSKVAKTQFAKPNGCVSSPPSADFDLIFCEIWAQQPFPSQTQPDQESERRGRGRMRERRGRGRKYT